MPKAARRITRNGAQPDRSAEKVQRSMRNRTQQKSAPVAPAKTNRNRRLPQKPALESLARSQSELEADPNRQSRLFSLPRELVRDIANRLPLASTISLTLTCKEAADVVGTQSWAQYKKLKQWSDDRQAFSALLVQDWGHILEFCVRCNALHPPLQPPRSHRETKLTKCCFGQNAMIDYLPKDESHCYNLVFTHIFDAMKTSESFASKNSFGPEIDLLAGEFTIAKRSIIWGLASSGRRVDGNLVVKHVHTFQSMGNKALVAKDLLSLPIRLCPHQSTTTDIPERSMQMRGSIELNGPLFTHAILSVLPAAARTGVDVSAFKKPTPLEREQMDAVRAGDKAYWRCRSCPTKYLVEHASDKLTITSWHSFGRDAYHAWKYWKWLVRREGKLLGFDKRNDEWWSPSRTVPDFTCE
ncbi:hypothetical protein BDV95DRAFT_594994 [Massariosphaeria phaeospora]|uniref:F-box domain-containing protein n=1 Tax=Massariosphaeria phaeospora TaxID=100035 RepID=A0A7C8I552_9PLEO|nr:hypothetical protein BDV95DRAFT_594994 [Massariosphaeria phaeospora]